MAIKRGFLIGLLAATALSSVSVAQSIEVDQLDAAQAFAPGIEIADPLGSDAWQGTSAARAERLLSSMPSDTQNPIVRNMLRRVVLSGLVPPAGADESFELTRIAAAQALASPDEYARFASRNPAARDPILRANNYIAQGNLQSACEISDAVQNGRSDSYWIRIRAACHDLREETAAADFARDILRDRGEETELIIPELATGFWIEAMALDAQALDQKMTELAGTPEQDTETADAITDSPVEESLADQVADDIDLPIIIDPLQASPLFGETLPEVETPPALTFDLDAAIIDTTDQGTAQLFILGRDGSAQAVSEFVTRAQAAGLDPANVLPRIPAVLDPTDMAAVDLPLFARYAVITRDIAMMQALFIATEDEPTRERLALASDAMGGGFYGRPLGDGLETAISEGLEGSLRDVMIALALGSDLTEEVEALIAQAGSQSEQVEWVGIDHAIDRAARAETLLRLADRLDADGDRRTSSLYRAIRALRKVGYSDTAGQLAAYEYLRDL